MMQALGEYIVSLTVAALISSIIVSLFQKGTMKTLIKLVCGMYLTFTALFPICQLEIPDFEILPSAYTEDRTTAVNQGVDMAETERNILIKDALETYILIKAEEMGCQVEIDLTLDSGGLPISVRLVHNLSTEDQYKLSHMITKDLGIPEESQQWIGENGRN